MKAIIYNKYGSPDVFKLAQVERPVPGEDEVLVKVHASSINSWDRDLMRGKPILSRIGGLIKPKYNILGADISGVVMETGSNVKKFKPGDKVFGDISGSGWGGFAEYVSVKEEVLAQKSSILPYNEAATVPHGGVLALQGLRDIGKIKKGQKVLINGAGGSMGIFAIQLAKLYGTEVTGVDNTSKLDMMKSIGADHVIDYMNEDFTKNGQEYDLILDGVANRSVFDYKRALSPNGVFVMVGGSTSTIFKTLILGPLISGRENKKMRILPHKPNPDDLKYLNTLFEEGKLMTVIDRIYPLKEVADAFRYYEKGLFFGKIVISVCCMEE